MSWIWEEPWGPKHLLETLWALGFGWEPICMCVSSYMKQLDLALCIYLYKQITFFFPVTSFFPLSLLTLQFACFIYSEQQMQQIISEIVNFIVDTHALKRRYFQNRTIKFTPELKKKENQTKPLERTCFSLKLLHSRC